MSMKSIAKAAGAAGVAGAAIGGGALAISGSLESLGNMANSLREAFGNGQARETVPNISEGFRPQNENYTVTISQVGSTARSIKANTPENFELQLQNNFIDLSTLMEGVMPAAGGNVSGILGAISATAGVFNQARIAQFQVWGGTMPLQFNLPIVFNAYTDPQKDVIDPARNLLAMASPPTNGIFLDAPSPSIADAISAARSGSFFRSLNKSIMLQIGRRFSLAGLVIESVSLNVSHKVERKSGLPICIEANIGFKSIISYGRDEVLAAFYGGGF